MKTMRVMGVMSGTSMDGVDYAVCEVGERRLELQGLWSARFPAELRRAIQSAANGSATSWQTAQLHHDLGRFYAAGAMPGLGELRPQIIGLHGQTVFHSPDWRRPATFQIGEPSYLARSLGCPVVSNFRAADLAAGGQGAPLATMFHLRVFGRPGHHVCVNNLGGISNVTSIDWRAPGSPKVVAFDTGPANVLIDLAVQQFSNGKRLYDRDGAWAARGRCCGSLLKRLLNSPFISVPPPKSTGRELFGESFLLDVMGQARRLKLSRFDVASTLVAFTAESIARNYRMHLATPPEIVVLSGGGAENPVLRRAIAEALAGQGFELSVMGGVEAGWPSNSIEPAAFALLAWLRWHERPGNLPETTGAKEGVLCGQVTAAPKPDLRAVASSRRRPRRS